MKELTPKRPPLRTGLAASLLLHLMFVAAAILSLPHWRAPLEPRGVDVSLIRLQPLPALRPRTAAARPASHPNPPPPTIPSLQIPQPRAPAPSSAPAAVAEADPDARAKVTALLRGSVGCSEAGFLHLSQRELDRCAKWRQAQAKPGLEIPAPIEAHKRAWFDATVAARNAPDHPPGLVCFGKPAHGIKLGPLPCYVEPPKGPFSQDVDAPPEPEH